MKQDEQKQDDSQNSDEEIIKKIGERIKQLRKKADYKNYENFAFDNEINRVQYGKMETGTNFTIKSLLKILAVHGLSLKDFFSEINIVPIKTKKKE